MSNPQKENGYTAIANEIIEQVISFGLSGQELSCTLFVMRKTYGFRKKNDYIALSQFQKAVNMSKVRASQVINRLVAMKILTVNEKLNGHTVNYCFNKRYKEWTPLRKTLTVKVLRNNRKGFTKEPLRKTLTTKETTTKETITKEKANPIIAGNYQHMNDDEFSNLFNEYLFMRREIKKPATAYAQNIALKKLQAVDLKTAKAMLEQSIESSWSGIFPLKGGQHGTHQQRISSEPGKYDGIGTVINNDE